MLSINFPVEIISDISQVTVKNLVVELRHDTDIVERMSKFNISLSENLINKIKNKNPQDNVFIDYPENKNIFQIIYFFPQEDKLTHDRSELFQKYKNDIVYIPDGNELEAYEIFTLATYEFDYYKSIKTPLKKYIFIENIDNQKQWFSDKKNLLTSILFARNLVNMSAHDINPESIVKIISEYKWKNFEIEIFGEAQLREFGCNLIRAVGYGSVRESYMVIIKPKKWKGWKKYSLIWKGVTFDSGGIQIKPDKYMIDMKCDMAWSATALGVALYLDSLDNLPLDIVIWLGFVENMTGSAAYKPLDVYSAYNKKTVEIHHTDAEGRLVLADVMSYVEEKYSIDHTITIATLTWASIYALWNNIAAVLGDDEKIIDLILKNTSPYEPTWRLPVEESVKESLKSEVADIKNVSDEKAWASVGAAFLSYFQWESQLTHLDIAGPTYRTKSFGYMPSGATGWGVKKLSEIFIELSK